ncbi:hypothetical protein ACFFWD_30285 [Bradyrhizobium erythrophlei]|uniref:hypothetical protein n=1 Tax=Bradyrhizobium erythrophlei TaxID=1437360 RepID=UPI0035F02C74
MIAFGVGALSGRILLDIAVSREIIRAAFDDQFWTIVGFCWSRSRGSRCKQNWPRREAEYLFIEKRWPIDDRSRRHCR